MRRQRMFFIFCSFFGLTITVCIYWRKLSMILITISSPNHVYCYWSESNGIMELGQGEWDKEMLIPSRCIFFHETTCASPNLSPQQACAVESAAKNNRNLNVFLFFLATGQLPEKVKRFVDILETYDNVYIRRIQLSTYITDTPIKEWFWENIRGLWETHDWLHKNFHDYVRMLTLWKFGGVSLNLNSVVLTSLDELLTTFVGVQDNRDMGIGVFGIDTSTNFGKNFANACMEIIKNTNADNYLRYNITRVMTEAVWNLCYQRNDKECRRFTIYPPKKFYPNLRRILPNKTRTEETSMIRMNTMMIHPWNDYNRSTEAEADTAMAYKMLARQHCPKIYEFTGESFLSWFELAH